MKNIKPTKILVYAVLGLSASLFLMPFYWMIIAATRTTTDMFSSPPKLLFGYQFMSNLIRLLEMVPFFRSFFNSLFVAGFRIMLTLFFCSLAGYAFAKHRFPGRKKLFFLILATMVVPPSLTVLPWYLLMSWFGWLDSLKALIIPDIANAFAIFWMTQYISQAIPSEVLDAARIDGSSEFNIYLRIVVPLILPALGVIGILTFVASWNEFLKPLIILSSPEKYTLPVTLAALRGDYATEYAVMMVGASIGTIPILIFFVLVNRYFMKAMTFGALKE